MQTSSLLEAPLPHCVSAGERASKQTVLPAATRRQASLKGIHCKQRGSRVTGAHKGTNLLLDDEAF